MVEAPISGPPFPNTPALMETGRAGDGRSWAKQVETSAEAEFRQARPPKHPRSQSRRWEMGPALPFPLQHMKGRLASIMRLYKHMGEQPLPWDDVAGRAIRHLHPEILPQDARHLGNQVVCMITEYHLTSSAIVQGAFYWFLPCRDLLPVSLFAYSFPGFLVLRCALFVWGMFVRGLHVETFVRVLRSSRCRLLNNCK